MDAQIFVQNVYKYSKLKGVSQTRACINSGVGKSFLSDIKTRGQTPSVDKVQMLAQYLGVTTSELLGEEIIFGEGDENDPVYRELRYIIDNASPEDRRRFMDLIELYKGLEADAAERRKQKNSPAKGEAVEEKQEPVFEACERVDHGTYRCVGCGKDHIRIYEDGTELRPCAVCGEIYWTKIK